MKQFTILIICLFTININAQLLNITPNDLEEGDLFGFVVEINGDDLLLNSSGSDDLQEDLGALYHYRYDGSEWQLNQKIIPTKEDVENRSKFGKWSSISEDWIAASIDGDDVITSVVFYKRENSEWIRHSRITNNIQEARFGWQIKLDGNQVVIGAINDFNQAGIRTGAAYIYEYNTGTDTWEQIAKLAPQDLEQGDLFGASVYIKDGLVAVSSRNDDDNGIGSGAVFVYEKEQGIWNQTTKITPDDAMPEDKFGYRINGDDNKLIISGFGNNDETGSVYIFRKDNNWIQEARLISDNVSQGDWFGSSISIEGDRAIVGARHHTGEVENSGALFVFEKENMDWIEKHKIIDPNGQTNNRFGGGHDFENEKLVVSGYGYNNNTGAAFSLNLNGLVATHLQPNSSFSIYPNPSYGNLVLDIGNKQIKEIEIYSMEGVLLRSFKYDGTAIDISQLDAGCYFLRRKYDALFIGKFIKI